MAKTIIREASRTLMEYRLLPGLTTSESTIDRISLRSPLVWSSRGREVPHLNIPLVSAAMQAVSGTRMAIELAKLGGSAVLFCSQTVENEAKMVREVKSYRAGFVDPKTVGPDITVAEVQKLREEVGYTTFPVVDEERRLLGLLTRNDYDLSLHYELPVKARMIPRSQLEVGVEISDLAVAARLLGESHQGVLPIVDKQDRLMHLVFRKDIHDHLDNPSQVLDSKGRLMVLGGINTHDYKERVAALVEAEVDGVVVDSSDGFSHYEGEALQWICRSFPDLPVVGGNIITAEGFRYLVECGAQAVKIGMGGGSICITQEQKGTGRGLATAVQAVAEERDKYFGETGRYIPVIADGGIETARDVTIALALGADYCMMGRYFARMEESPTEKVIINNRVMKPYWGEGAARARAWRENRYHQAKFVEGVEGFVEFAGKLRDNLEETLSKIKASMSSCGVKDIETLHREAVLEVVSALSIREGQVHDIYMPGNEGLYGDRSWGG